MIFGYGGCSRPTGKADHKPIIGDKKISTKLFGRKKSWPKVTTAQNYWYTLFRY